MFPRVDVCLPTQTGSSLRVGTVSRPCDALSLAFPSSHLTPPAGRGSLGSSITYTTCILSRSVIFDSWQPHNYSPPGSSVHGILQARILKWVAISSSPRLQGIFPTQGSNSRLLYLLHWQADSFTTGTPWEASPEFGKHLYDYFSVSIREIAYLCFV